MAASATSCRAPKQCGRLRALPAIRARVAPGNRTGAVANQSIARQARGCSWSKYYYCHALATRLKPPENMGRRLMVLLLLRSRNAPIGQWWFRTDSEVTHIKVELRVYSQRPDYRCAFVSLRAYPMGWLYASVPEEYAALFADAANGTRLIEAIRRTTTLWHKTRGRDYFATSVVAGWLAVTSVTCSQRYDRTRLS